MMRSKGSREYVRLTSLFSAKLNSRWLNAVAVSLVLAASAPAVVSAAAVSGEPTSSFSVNPPRFSWTESDLGPVPEKSTAVGNGWSDPNGWHYGLVIDAPGGGRRLWLDGVLHPVFDDFQHSGVMDAGICFSRAFSSDGKRLAYPVRWKGKMHMVIDGNPGRAEEKVSRPEFSPNGRRLAYQVIRNGRAFVLLDGKPGPPCDGPVGEVVFSSDSRHIAYVARHGGKTRLVVDQRERVDWPGSGTPVFSPNGKRLAFLDLKTGCVVVDGKKGPEFPSNTGSGPVFSSDSRHFAYDLGLRTANCWLSRAFVDDRPLTIPNGGTGAWHVVFSPNLQRWGCFIRSMGKTRSEQVVIDGKPVATFDGAWGPTFSSDSLRVAYMAEVETNWWMVVDGKLEEMVKMGSSNPYFSPNGKRLAYMAGIGPAYWMMVDGSPGPKFKGVLLPANFWRPEPEEVPPFTIPRFSPDSTHVVYAAQKDGKWDVLLDNHVIGGQYDTFVSGGPSFHASGTVEMLGIRSGRLYRYVGTPAKALHRRGRTP